MFTKVPPIASCVYVFYSDGVDVDVGGDVVGFCRSGLVLAIASHGGCASPGGWRGAGRQAGRGCVRMVRVVMGFWCACRGCVVEVPVGIMMMLLCGPGHLQGSRLEDVSEVR